MKISQWIALGLLVAYQQAGAVSGGGGDASFAEFHAGAQRIINENPAYLGATPNELQKYSEVIRRTKLRSVDTLRGEKSASTTKEMCAERSPVKMKNFFDSSLSVNEGKFEVALLENFWNSSSSEVKEMTEAYALMKLSGYSDVKIHNSLSSFLEKSSICDQKPAKPLSKSRITPSTSTSGKGTP